jgi:hypothetical protein
LMESSFGAENVAPSTSIDVLNFIIHLFVSSRSILSHEICNAFDIEQTFSAMTNKIFKTFLSKIILDGSLQISLHRTLTHLITRNKNY